MQKSMLLPDDLLKSQEGQEGKLVAETYRLYRKALAANNALDFDDLLLIPVQFYSKMKN